MHAFRHQRRKIPKCVMSRSRLRKSAVRLHFDRMNEVWKFDGVLNEEHGYVVANEVEIAFLRIEFNRKASHIARQIAGASAACDRGDAHEDFGLLLRVLQKRSPSQSRE